MNSALHTSLRDNFLEQGFLHVTQNDELTQIRSSVDFEAFVKSWDSLPLDTYLIDKGKYRYRRYSVFNSNDGSLTKLPYEPHYQTREYNRVHGGFSRFYDELRPTEVNNPVLQQLIDWNLQLIAEPEQKDWRVQCHQFRICATQEEMGKPAPEGVHQDGADYVFIMLIDRHNVVGAYNTINNESGEALYEKTLIQQGEAILINDHRYWHGVSDMQPGDVDEKSYRDTLVLTFHRLDDH